MIKANIITAEEAGINNKDISSKALEVVKGLQNAGYQAYLVGGCVRDLLLNMKPKDFDVATNATPEQVKVTFKRNARIIGRRFKIVHVRFGYEVIEVATFRADASDRDNVGRNEMSEGDQGQLLRDNVFGTLEEDVVRRDFRANALYYDPEKGEILDFMGGVDDIRNQKLISIGEPRQRFTEDPVRMLRVVRFAAKLGFEMEPEAKEMIEDEGKLLAHVSSARLFEEVLKLFHGGAAYDTYLMLRKYGLFKYLFPFTDQIAVDGVEGMPERALRNTDKRIGEGKPVIPAFLFACMLWEPVKADAQILMDDGTPEPQAWRIAMSDALRDQDQYVAVPKRLAEIILDIWNIHYYSEAFENVVASGGVGPFLRSLGKPIWVTESGEQGPNNQLAYAETVWPFLKEEIPQIERFYYFQYGETGPIGSNFGLRTTDPSAPVSDLYISLRDQ